MNTAKHEYFAKKDGGATESVLSSSGLIFGKLSLEFVGFLHIFASFCVLLIRGSLFSILSCTQEAHKINSLLKAKR